MNNWFKVEDKLPEVGKRVMVYLTNEYGRSFQALGFYCEYMSVQANPEYPDECDWLDEDDDGEFYFPEGWYEWTYTTDIAGELKTVKYWKYLDDNPE